MITDDASLGEVMRRAPDVVEVRRNRWVWASHIPWLPDLLPDADRHGSAETAAQEWQGAHAAMLTALAGSGVPGAALQIRLTADDAAVDVAIHVLGAAATREGAASLARVVAVTLPDSLPWSPLAAPAVRDLFVASSTTARIDGMLEVRRRIDPLDAAVEPVRGAEPAPGAVLSWGSGAASLRGTIAGMRQQRGRTHIALHAEAATPSAEALSHLDGVLSELSRGSDTVYSNPLAPVVMKSYSERLRAFARPVLSVRVAVASNERVSGGLPEVLGVELAGAGASVVRPRSSADAAALAGLFDALSAQDWGMPADPGVASLLFLASPDEAAAVVRCPFPPHGGVPGIETVRSSFLPRARHQRRDSLSSVVLGDAPSGGPVTLALDEINRHVLVAGLPGFGKTTTVQALLAQLHEKHDIPFLVIDPAKSDYQRLVALPNPHPGGPPVRRVVLAPDVPAFNPLAVPDGVTPQTHAGRVLAAFDAALGLSSAWPLGYITLGRALFAAYEQADGDAPTLRTLYASVGDVIRRSRFTGDDGTNVRASLLGRIEFLARGPLGVSLAAGSDAGVDWAGMTETSTILELRQFAGPVERSLVFALLLAGLISYREAHPAGRLVHVTVLEEAHRVLSADGAGGEGVRLLVEALAELRSAGEGFVIVDQAPTTLHPGVLKLAGSLLTHRVVDSHDRELLGAAMLLDQRESMDIARLGQGQALVYSPERLGSALVQVKAVPLVARDGHTAHTLVDGASQDPIFCVGCLAMCKHEPAARELAENLMPTSDVAALVKQLLEMSSSIGEVRCAAARIVARSAVAGGPGSVFRALSEVDERIITVAADRRRGRAPASRSAVGTGSTDG